jgi:hypothetical protein
MSFTVTRILSSTVGLLLNETDDSTAMKLKDVDITQTKIREAVLIPKLDDVKTGLNDALHKDLLSSYNCLKEGIDLFNVCFGRSIYGQKTVADPNHEDRSATSEMSSGFGSEIPNESLELSRVVAKLKIGFEGQFERAKKQCEDARGIAAHVLSDDALGIEDRLVAARLRIVATILGCIATPEEAIEQCLSILKQLHGLQAITKIFSVLLNPSGESSLEKEELQNVRSVMLINCALYELFSRLSTKSYWYFDWPAIELADRCFQPILHWHEISTVELTGGKLPQLSNRMVLDNEVWKLFGMNTRDEIFVAEQSKDIKVIFRTGESKVVELPAQDGERHIAGLDVGSNNNIYVLLFRRTESDDANFYALCVLNESYSVTGNCTLDFVDTRCYHGIKMALNHNNDVVIIQPYDPHVYICDSTGQLKQKFVRNKCASCSLKISNKNDLMVTSDHEKGVCFYGEEGHLKSIIEVPEGHMVDGAVFHYGIRKIIVLTFSLDEDSYFLLCYSENGELEKRTFFLKATEFALPRIKSHPSGRVAVFWQKNIVFI